MKSRHLQQGTLSIKDFLKLGAIALMLTLTFWAAGHVIPPPAQGHPGGLSSKDGCHRDKKAQERHWHVKGTNDRGGPCVDGKHATDPPTRSELGRIIEDLEGKLHLANDRLERDRANHRVALGRARQAVSRAESAAAAKDRLVADADRRVAMMERKLKAVLSGAPVCMRPRAALQEKAKAGTWGARGWRDQAALLEECLTSGE